jgi:spore coat protein U-like protein
LTSAALGAGSVKCTFAFNATSLASTLTITSLAPQRIKVGSVVQNCSGNASYSLIVASANCAYSPSGGKLVEPTTNSLVAYSIEFDNPTTGGSKPVVTGLLAKACSNADGRDVQNSRINNESSAVYMNYTGSTALAAGTYSDTLTVTLNQL